MKDRSSATTARQRGMIRNAGWGLLALTALWLGLGALWAAAADRKAEPTSIKVMKDVSYGPDTRNVMDFYLPESGPTPHPRVICIHGQWLEQVCAGDLGGSSGVFHAAFDETDRTSVKDDGHLVTLP